jgi:hypothetical protein
MLTSTLWRMLVPAMHADGVAGVADDTMTAPDVVVDLPFGELPEAYFERQMGSKAVNPTGRPLRPTVMHGVAGGDELDGVIRIMGDDAYMTPKEIAAYEKANVKTVKPKESEKSSDEHADPNDEKPVDEKPEAGGGKNPDEKPKDDKAKQDDVDPDVAKFYETTGLTSEAFAALPKPAQERIAKIVETSTTATESQNEEHEKTTRLLNAMNSDPVIRARLEEKRTGKSYVANDMPRVNPTDLDTKLIEGLGLSDSERGLLAGEVNRLLLKHAREAVKVERSVADAAAKSEALQREGWGVILKLGEIDKRLAVENPDETFKKGFAPGSEMEKFGKFLIDSGIGLPTVINWGPRQLYAAYAESRGWAKERDTKIAEGATKTLLERLQNPPTAKMKTMPRGKRPPTSESDDFRTEAGQEGLITELVAGKTTTLERLLERHRGDPEMLATIAAIQEKAVAAVRKRQALAGRAPVDED